MKDAERREHGWQTEEGYLCDGCAVRSPHEHRCHGSDGGPPCACECNGGAIPYNYAEEAA